MQDPTKTPNSFEGVISNLNADTQERMRNEFKRLTENGRACFDKLFDLAYARGKTDGAREIEQIQREASKGWRR